MNDLSYIDLTWQFLSLGLTCPGMPAEPLLPVGTQSDQLVEDRLPVPESASAPSIGGTCCERAHNLGLKGFMPGDMLACENTRS